MKGLYKLLIALTFWLWVPFLLVLSPIYLIFFLGSVLVTNVAPVRRLFLLAVKKILFGNTRFQKFIWLRVYNFICYMNKEPSFTCMNYGYISTTGPLVKEDNPEKYPLQLYHFVASAFLNINSYKNLLIVEVGCGRGGGLAYVTRTFSPKMAVGVDYSLSQVDLCIKLHKMDNLTFIQGDAENLPIKDESVDIVINIESSHCYPDFFKFASEVFRVLKPGGLLLYADFIAKENKKAREEAFMENKLNIKEMRDITEGVLMSMDAEEQRKLDGVKNLNWIFRKGFDEFIGLKGTHIYEKLLSRELLYNAYCLVKEK